jgi:hypothetical protein
MKDMLSDIRTIGLMARVLPASTAVDDNASTACVWPDILNLTETVMTCVLTQSTSLFEPRQRLELVANRISWQTLYANCFKIFPTQCTTT